MKKTFLLLLALMLNAVVSFGQAFVWTNGGGTGNYGLDTNWNSGFAPGQFDTVVFQGSSSTANCLVTNTQLGAWFEIGNGSPAYGSLIIKNGGNLESKAVHWSAVGWTGEATLLVEAGGIFTTKSHLWLGFNPGSKSHVQIYGTVNVGEMFGMNFENLANATSSADLTVYNGGVLNLAQFAGDGKSIRGANMIMNVMGGGQIVIAGDQTGILATHIAANQLKAPGGTVQVAFNAGTGKTTITSTAAPLGIQEFNTLNFQVYPNPTADNVNITSETSISNIKVYNTLGQLLLDEKGKSSVNLAGLSNGNYLVKAEDNSGKVGVTQILKQ
jgi:Secretion system C-terminal sorting domain